MWRRNRIRSFFTRSILDVDRIFITPCLSVPEYETVGINAFFFHQVLDHFIYTVPTQLLGSLAGFSVPDNGYFTTRIVPHLVCNAGSQRFTILVQGNCSSFEHNAGQVADKAFGSSHGAKST